MELKYASLVIILGFFLIIIKSNSYECMQNATNCISCNDEITFRYLFKNNCLCRKNYFDNKTLNAVCV